VERLFELRRQRARQLSRDPLSNKLAPVPLAFSPDGQTLAIGLLHKENVKLKEGGGFEPPPESQSGVVVLCELQKRKS
jgi:hypothetical protein